MAVTLEWRKAVNEVSTTGLMKLNDKAELEVFASTWTLVEDAEVAPL